MIVVTIHGAARLFRPLAEQGLASAQHKLGLMYTKAWGVQKDYRKALKWFHMAAEQGHARAQYNLGLVYERGRGVRRDLVRAHMWYSIAAGMLSGDDEKKALKHRDHVASLITTEQIEEAREMTRRCQQSEFKECL